MQPKQTGTCQDEKEDFAPARSSCITGRPFPLTARKGAQRGGWSCRARSYICRLDICWSFFFFVFLVCVGAFTASVTQTLISKNLLETWHSIHFIRISSVTQRIDTSNRDVMHMARAFQTVNLREALSTGSEHTLSLLCASLDKGDLLILYRAFVYFTMVGADMTGCMHGLANTGSRKTLTGYMYHNRYNDGTYLINSTTYEFVRPLQMMSVWPQNARNSSNNNAYEHLSIPFTQLTEAYYNGSVDAVDPQLFWSYPVAAPHLILYSLPIGMVARGIKLKPVQHPTDLVQVRLDGSQLLVDYDNVRSADFSAAAFIRQSMQNKDPLVMSNNWGQWSVSNNSIYTAFYIADTLRYLPVSNISDPLMRAALKHVSLKALQAEGYNRTVDFRYGGAPATVTAVHVRLSSGLQIPLVFVSRMVGTTVPYRRIMDICNGVTAVIIVAFTALFWWFARTTFAEPLRRMTALLLASIATGRRALFFRSAGECVEVSEVQQLVAAHNAMMRQLRDIDAFVPAAVRARGQTADGLQRQPATVVYVAVHPRHRGRADDVAVLAHDSSATPARTRRRLVAVVEETVHAYGLANSGPFPTPDALAAFVAAVHALSARYRGVVQLLTPDNCVLHFGERARSAPTDDVEAAGACAKQDALDAVGFMFDLLRWVDRYDAPNMPDVRVLADSGLFVCGQYRPRGSEQTLSVALGRDVQHKLGHVPALLGVRVAMTEETAVLLRDERLQQRSAEGVRTLPMAAFRVGRPRLNADVVVLFEALPGDAVHNEAWLCYARCAFVGFEHMLRGDYAGALRAFKEVASIADLEPGLMPRSLRREAAHSDAVGGAVSTQVERLMAVCERRLRDGNTSAYYYVRHIPLGIDAVLRGTGFLEAPLPSASTRPVSAAATAVGRRADAYGTVFMGHQRYLFSTHADDQPLRCVVGDFPQWVTDQHGMRWRLPVHGKVAPRTYSQRTRFTALGSAGTLCTAVFCVFRDVPSIIRKAVRNAPDGPLSDALRSAVPVWEASAQQRSQLAYFYDEITGTSHPNILQPVGYSLSVEGGAVVLWEYCPGGSLRQLTQRYPTLHAVVISRFGMCVLSALAHLHAHGRVHGSLNLDNILVDADGKCRLMGHSLDRRTAHNLFALPRTCYVSPAMAGDALPTPACDMFCFGLLILETVTRQPAWRWAPDAAAVETEQEALQRSDEADAALAALMEEGGEAFSAAVVDGRVVPNTSLLDLPAVTGHYSSLAREVTRRCMSYDPLQRPTAAELWEVNIKMLVEMGLKVDENE